MRVLISGAAGFLASHLAHDALTSPFTALRIELPQCALDMVVGSDTAGLVASLCCSAEIEIRKRGCEDSRRP